MPFLTDATIAELLAQYQPVLNFDPTEQFFPSAAEEVLAHQATERWDNPATHQRGTAVLRVPLNGTDYTSSEVVAGVDDPNGAPLTFDATPPTGIGQAFHFTPARQDLFLDCAGWDDTAMVAPSGTAGYSEGSVEYLQSLFSELGHAMNNTIPESTPNPTPKVGVPPASGPTIYAELEWAGQYPVLDEQRVESIGGSTDFAQSAGPGGPTTFTGLDNYLSLTYYFFYPAMEPSPVAAPDPDERYREGQWEAVTIYLLGEALLDQRDPQGRPDFNSDVTLRPRFVAYSSGYGFGDDSFNPLGAQVQPWPATGVANSQLRTLNNTPLVYVTAGTHRNLFAIDATVQPGSTSPNPALNTTGGALMGAAGSAMGICAGVLLATPPPANAAGFVACVVIAAVLFLIGLILFILSFFIDTQSTPTTESPQSTQPGSDVARDDGPAGVPAGSGISVSGATPTPTTLRLISEYSLDPTPPVTTYPLPQPGAIELPSWWSFAGRWGVRVTPTAAGTWDSGSRRTDPYGRSRGYWNAYQLVSYVAANAGTVSL